MKSFENKMKNHALILPAKEISNFPTTSQMSSRDLEMKPLVPKIDLSRLGPLTITIQIIRCAITREFKVTTITVHQLLVETAAPLDKATEVLLRTMATSSILMVEHNSQAFLGPLQIIVHHKTPKVNQA